MRKGKYIPSATFAPSRVEKQPDGSYLTYFSNQKYPVHGKPTEMGLLLGDIIKKYALIFPRVLINSFRRGPINAWLDELSRGIEVFSVSQDPNEFSPVVKNLYLVLIYIFGYTERGKLLIMGGCKILEEDKAYRWRWQDIMMAADRTRMILRPGKEARRLIRLYFAREQRSHYKNLSIILQLATLSPKIRKNIKKFAENADFTKFYFDNYDLWGAIKHQVVERYSYSYGGWTLEEMKENYKKM